MIIDDKIRKFFGNKKNLLVTFLIIITFLSLVGRGLLLGFKSWDYINCLLDWVNKFRENGGFKALKLSIGNYNILYMTFLATISYLPISPLIPIKLLSILFDYICAVFSALIVGEIASKDKTKKYFLMGITYTAVLFLPTVLMNGALWAQCDIMYTTFTLISIYYILKEKTTISFVFAGLAFACKLQFIFILPIYIILYFRKKNFSILHFLIIPLVNFITCIPALIAGRPLKDCLLIYFAQTGQGTNQLTNNFPNIYRFVPDLLHNHQGDLYMILTVLCLGYIVFYIMYNNVKINKNNILQLSIVSILIMTQLLPYMHERYAFCAEVLILINVIVNKKDYYLLATSQLAVLTEYFNFLSGINSIYIDICCLAYIISCVIFTARTIKNLNEFDGE